MQVNNVSSVNFGSTYSASIAGCPKKQRKILKKIVRENNGIFPRNNKGTVRVSVDKKLDPFVQKLFTALETVKVKVVNHDSVPKKMIDKVLKTGVFKGQPKPVFEKMFEYRKN